MNIWPFHGLFLFAIEKFTLLSEGIFVILFAASYCQIWLTVSIV